jgi:hypothetical protein
MKGRLFLNEISVELILRFQLTTTYIVEWAVLLCCVLLINSRFPQETVLRKSLFRKNMYRINPSIFPKFERESPCVNNFFNILVFLIYPIHFPLIPTRDITAKHTVRTNQRYRSNIIP